MAQWVKHFCPASMKIQIQILRNHIKLYAVAFVCDSSASRVRSEAETRAAVEDNGSKSLGVCSSKHEEILPPT